MKIGAYYPVGLEDPSFTHVYGGDQKGHVWRLDVSTFPSKQSPAPAAMVTYNGPTDITTDAHYVGLLANLQDSTGRIQPITARPAGTHLGPDPGNPQTRIYYVGTGRYLGNSDLTDQGPGGIAWQQTIYGIRDQLDKAPVNGGAFVAKANFRTGNPVQQFLGQSGVNRTVTKNPVDWTTQDGFFIDLNPHFPGVPPEGNSPGERVFLDVRLILGTLLITSNFPPTGGACVAGGHSFQYGLDFRTGGYIGNDSTAPAGLYVKDFLVGSAIEQTSDGTLKALNKSITGENLTTPIPTDTNFTGKRFSYRER
jgi:type IV pilus assembly protein PilY1